MIALKICRSTDEKKIYGLKSKKMEEDFRTRDEIVCCREDETELLATDFISSE